MEKYEIAILYDPDLEIDFGKAEERFKQIIANNNGKISDTDNWGKRRTAYKIKGHDSAIYVFYGVELQPEVVRAVNSELNITDEVIRFLITKPDLKKQAKAESERAAKLKRADRTLTDETNDE